MNKTFVLQACPRSFNVPRDLDGSSCVQDLARGYYKHTDYTADTTKGSRDLLKRANKGEIPEYPASKYKFKIRKVQLWQKTSTK